MLTISELTLRHAQKGRIVWIGLRPARREPMVEPDSVELLVDGLIGDRRSAPGKRAVTLLQAEHLPVIASLAGIETVTPSMLRRNLVVSGISLSSLKDQQFAVGSAILQGTGICAPCSRMEETLGHGGYNAVRGHGGITAEVVREGRIGLNDVVKPFPNLPA